MTGTMLILYGLLAFMVLAALVAVETRDLLSSVLCLGAVGFGLAVADLLLGAPDLALTQAVVEVFAVVLLIRTVLIREDTTHEFTTDTAHVALVGGLVVLLAIGAYLGFSEIGPTGFEEQGPLLRAVQKVLRKSTRTGRAQHV